VQRLLIIFTALFCFLSFSASGQATSSIGEASIQAHSGEYGGCFRSMPDDHGDVLWSETSLNAAAGFCSDIPQSVVRVSEHKPVLQHIRGPPAK